MTMTPVCHINMYSADFAELFIFCFSPSPQDIPSRPVGRPNVAKIAGDSILLTWNKTPSNDPPSNESSVMYMYIIEGKDAHEIDWVLIATDVVENSYWVSSINPEGQYVFRVRAEGDNGISEPSEESDVVCLADLRKYIHVLSFGIY